MNKKLRYLTTYTALIALLLILSGVSIAAGSISIPAGDIFKVLAGKQADSTYAQIITGIRIPRVLAAIFLGGALSLSGYLLQTFFANPIAGPFVLGISQGAKLVVALTLILTLRHGLTPGSPGLILAAFMGSLISTGFILLISRRTQKMSLLVICGIMIGYICSAVTDFVITFANDSDIVNLHSWSLGSFSGTTMANARFFVPIVTIALLLAFLLSKPISAYLLGETSAASMGVDLPRFRLRLILLSSLLSACVTAFAGPVSFVGIAVPHLIKKLFGTAKPLVIIPAAFLGGALFCLLCDLIARTLFMPTELSISTVTAFFGAPVVIAIMLGRQKR
ncbi:MAG: iron ABC transporter permease [Eubacteriales bacterium]